MDFLKYKTCIIWGLTEFLDCRSFQIPIYLEVISRKMSNSYKYFLRYLKRQLTKPAIMSFRVIHVLRYAPQKYMYKLALIWTVLLIFYAIGCYKYKL